MSRAAKKPAPKKLTVAQARKLGLHADQRRLENEAIVREAEAEAARELGRKQAEEKAAAKAAAAAKRKAGRRKTSREIKDPVARSETYVANISSRPTPVKNQMARLHDLFGQKTESMMKVMHDIAEDKSVHASVRLEAATRFLDRLLGKPKEHVEVSDASSGAESQDAMLTLLGNMFEAVGLDPLLLPAPKDEGSLASEN